MLENRPPSFVRREEELALTAELQELLLGRDSNTAYAVMRSLRIKAILGDEKFEEIIEDIKLKNDL